MQVRNKTCIMATPTVIFSCKLSTLSWFAIPSLIFEVALFPAILSHRRNRKLNERLVTDPLIGTAGNNASGCHSRHHAARLNETNRRDLRSVPRSIEYRMEQWMLYLCVIIRPNTAKNLIGLETSPG